MRGGQFWVLFFILSVSCSDSEEVKVDCSISDLSIRVVKITYADCGLSNGQITVEANGGNPVYRFSLDNGTAQSSGVFENVIPGFREISVTDNDGCKKTVKTFMSSKDPFQVVTYTTPSGCKLSNGTITVVPLGGVPPYKYQLGENNDNYQASNVWGNLAAGRHSIWVEDANRCFFGVYVQVSSGVSFSETIKPIIDNNCAVGGCHDGTQSPDLTTFNGIKANATAIKAVTTDKSMPLNNSLSPDQINQIACWVDDGALNN